ncbi:hypothetical protein CHH91_04250 [Virgibacillus sp. 7505]|nr:hypothetical protein CHH91_04250 [Virgibacillus sp. 7505]
MNGIRELLTIIGGGVTILSICPLMISLYLFDTSRGKMKLSLTSLKEQSIEGVVLKKADSIYKPGTRSPNWLKVINYQYEDVCISGLRKKEFGLLLSFKDGSPAGILEFYEGRT